MIYSLILLPIALASSSAATFREEMGIAASLAHEHRMMVNNLANENFAPPEGYNEDLSQSLLEASRAIRSAVAIARSAAADELDAKRKALEETVSRAKALEASIPLIRLADRFAAMSATPTAPAAPKPPVLVLMTESQRQASLNALSTALDRAREILHYISKASTEFHATNAEMIATLQKASAHCCALIDSLTTRGPVALVREITEHASLTGRLSETLFSLLSREPSYATYRNSIALEEAQLRLDSASALERYLRSFATPDTSELADTISVYLGIASPVLQSAEVAADANAAVLQVMHAMSAVLVRQASAEIKSGALSLGVSGGVLDIILDLARSFSQLRSRIFGKSESTVVADRPTAEALVIRAVKVIESPGVREALDMLCVSPDEVSVADLEAAITRAADPGPGLNKQKADDTIKVMELARARANKLMGVNSECHAAAQEIVSAIRAVVDSTQRSDVRALNKAIDHLNAVMAKPVPSMMSEERTTRAVNAALEQMSDDLSGAVQGALTAFMEDTTNMALLIALENATSLSRPGSLPALQRMLSDTPASREAVEEVTAAASELIESSEGTPAWADSFAIFLSIPSPSVREVERMKSLIGFRKVDDFRDGDSPRKKLKDDVVEQQSLENIHEKLEKANELLDKADGRLTAEAEALMGRLAAWLHKAASGADVEVIARIKSLIDKARPLFMAQRRLLELPSLSSAQFSTRGFAEVVKEFMQLEANRSTDTFIDIYTAIPVSRAMRFTSTYAAISFAIEGHQREGELREALKDFRERLLKACPYEKLIS